MCVSAHTHLVSLLHLKTFLHLLLKKMSSFIDIYHSPDILSHVFSFLPLPSIAMVERSSKYFVEMLRADYFDKTIYHNTICKLFKIDIMREEMSSLNFNQFLRGENCRELLKEFYQAPFIGKYEYADFASIDSYSNKGGVIDFSLYSPCKLLKGVLKHFRLDLDEDVKRTLHKFVLISAVSFWELDEKSKFQIGIPQKELLFKFNDRDYSSDSFPFTQYSIGKGLVMMFNNFKEIESNYSIAISESGKKDSVIFYAEILRNAKPNEMWSDIFAKCSDPPYGIRGNATEDVAKLITEFYNDHDGSCEHYCWDDCLLEGYGSWSAYWLSGAEWWGCYSLTSYDFIKERFVVAIASTSD